MSTKHALPLPRGSACRHCRRRKVKCDAQKPVCTPCMRGPNPGQCDYDLSSTTSPNPENVQASIEKLKTFVTSIDLDLSTNPDALLAVATKGLTTVKPAASSGSVSNNMQEPPPFIIRVLLDTFVRHISSVPFFLNLHRFRQRALLSLPFGNPARPHPALLSAAYLCSYYLASIKEPELTLLEPELLEPALKYVEEESWAKTESHRAVEIIQAELIIAVYFFKSLDILQGRRHLAHAVDLAFRCRLHLTREHAAFKATVDTSQKGEISLPDPVDSIEAGERINAFWMVLYINKVWSCTFNAPSLVSLTDISRKIEIPWPLDMSQYERGLSIPATFSSAPIQSFLHGTADDVHSYVSYSVKAALLYDQAYRLFPPGGKVDTTQRNSPQFLALMTLITKLVVLMPTSNEIADLFRTGRPNEGRQRITSKCMAYAANITLHARFSRVDLGSRKACFESACRMVEMQGILFKESELVGIGVDPLQVAVWRIGCQALVDEILILKTGASLIATDITKDESTIDNVTQMLERGLLAIQYFSQRCPMARYQYIQLQELLALV